MISWWILSMTWRLFSGCSDSSLHPTTKESTYSSITSNREGQTKVVTFQLLSFPGQAQLGHQARWNQLRPGATAGGTWYSILLGGSGHKARSGLCSATVFVYNLCNKEQPHASLPHATVLAQAKVWAGHLLLSLHGLGGDGNELVCQAALLLSATRPVPIPSQLATLFGILLSTLIYFLHVHSELHTRKDNEGVEKV